MADEDTDEEVEVKVLPLRTQAENELLKCARKYARMKLFRSYVDPNANNYRGCVVSVCAQDGKDQEKFLADQVLYLCERLLLSMSVDERDGSLEE